MSWDVKGNNKLDLGTCFKKHSRLRRQQAQIPGDRNRLGAREEGKASVGLEHSLEGVCVGGVLEGEAGTDWD